MSLGGTTGMFVMSGVLSFAPLEWVFYLYAAFSLGAGTLIVAMRSYFTS